MRDEEKYKFPAGHDDPDHISEATLTWIRGRLKDAKCGKRDDDGRVIQAGNIRYDDETRFVLGFMGTAPHFMAVEAYESFLSAHPNNIGVHTCNVDEIGFLGTQQLEAEALGMLGDLHGDSTVDGYLSFDGSEANIQALWVGRDHLMRTSGPPGDARVCLLASHLAHYSLEKAYNLLRLGGGFITLPADERGRVAVGQLEKKIRVAYRDFGLRRFLVVAIGGSTLLGSVDDTRAIGDLLTRLEREYNHKLKDEHSPNRAGFFLHVDAAFGGFVTPFLDPPILTGFNAHPAVRSMTIDPHKMGLSVYPGGAYLCRKGLMDEVSSPVSYIGGGRNVTIAGSRPGAEAAACWAVMHALGRKGYETLVQRCMQVTVYLEEQLRERLPKLRVWPHTLNLVAFAFPGYSEEEIKSRLKRLQERDKHKYTFGPAQIPSNLADPSSPLRTLVHCVIMPHRWVRDQGESEKVLNGFVTDLASELA